MALLSGSVYTYRLLWTDPGIAADMSCAGSEPTAAASIASAADGGIGDGVGATTTAPGADKPAVGAHLADDLDAVGKLSYC